MREEFITELKPGDIFKLENRGTDLNRIVISVTVEQVIYSPYTLVRVRYVFADEDYNGTVFQTENAWEMTKKVYKVLI